MNIFKTAAQKIYEQARKDKRLIRGPFIGSNQADRASAEWVIQTQIGSVASDSEPMNRSAPHTRNSVDHPFGEAEEMLAKQAVDCLSRERIIALDTIIGRWSGRCHGPFHHPPEQYAQIAYGLKLLFDRPEARVVEDPTYTIIYFTDEHFESNKAKKLLNKDITVRLFMGDQRARTDQDLSKHDLSR